MSLDKQKLPVVLKMEPVKSSNIQELGYDAGSHELRVRFISGDLFSYANVPESVYEALRNAKSIGSYFAHNVRSKFRVTPL